MAACQEKSVFLLCRFDVFVTLAVSVGGATDPSMYAIVSTVILVCFSLWMNRGGAVGGTHGGEFVHLRTKGVTAGAAGSDRHTASDVL